MKKIITITVNADEGTTNERIMYFTKVWAFESFQDTKSIEVKVDDC